MMVNMPAGIPIPIAIISPIVILSERVRPPPSALSVGDEMSVGNTVGLAEVEVPIIVLYAENGNGVRVNISLMVQQSF